MVKFSQIYSVIFVSIIFIFLVNCGPDVGFTNDGALDTPYQRELLSRLEKDMPSPAEGQKEIKKDNPKNMKGKRKRIADRRLPRRPQPGPGEQKKPPWVADLDKQFSPKIQKGKNGNRRTHTITDRALTSVKPEKKVPPKVDFIIVVDSSSSMDPFLRDSVKDKFRNFVETLKPLNWRMIFTSADNGRSILDDHGKKGQAMKLELFGGIITPMVLDRHYDLGRNTEKIFIDTIGKHDASIGLPQGGSRNHSWWLGKICYLPPRCGGNNEQPLMSLQLAIAKNKHLLRRDAHLAALIISDSDEGLSSSPAKRVKADDVYNTFESELRLGDESKHFIAYGIIMVPGEETCRKQYMHPTNDNDNVYSANLARMAQITGGTNYSLCDDNYIPLARRIVSDFYKIKI